MTALIWVVFENQELLVIIIHVMVGSLTEPWGEERCVTTLKRNLQPGMPSCLFL